MDSKFYAARHCSGTPARCGVLLALVLASHASGQSVSVLSLSGKQFQGELKSLDGNSLSISSDSKEPTTLATNELSYLTVTGVEPVAQTSGRVKVRLIDNSLLVASNISSGSDGWQLTTSLQKGLLQIPNDLVSNVQFADLNEQAQKTWTSLLQSDRSADVLAVLRGGDLETLSGAILGINSEKVEFELDGQPIKAPRTKVAGLIWLRRSLPSVTKAAEFTAKDGSSLHLKGIKLSSEGGIKSFELETVSGIHLQIPLDASLRIDYSTANLQWLDQVAVLESESLFQIVDDELKPMRDKLLAPKFIQTAGEKSSFGDDPTRANLVFDGPGRFVFRAPDGYTRLVTTVQRKMTANALLPTVITIKCDDKEIWSQKLDGEEMRLDVQAKVEPNKKCEITVNCDGPIPFGTYIALLHPHLLP